MLESPSHRILQLRDWRPTQRPASNLFCPKITGGRGGNLARSETCSGGLLQEQRASCLKRRARMCRSCFSEQMFARWACLLKALTAGTLLWVALSWHQRYWREDLTVDLWSQSGPIWLFHALRFDHRAYWWVISDYIVLWIELRWRKYVFKHFIIKHTEQNLWEFC